MREKFSGLFPAVIRWLSGLAGLVVGFKVYSLVNPRFHTPFFSDAWGMVFVITAYSLLYVMVGPRFQKWLEQSMSDLRKRHG
ncbi:MAG: hypothetical protein KatS3mg022_3308 [Armatimonadota bacterium]|nr:MAG: hypothetical protein KatS3mg022_3308 [Armatimonadota bacterium]